MCPAFPALTCSPRACAAHEDQLHRFATRPWHHLGLHLSALLLRVVIVHAPKGLSTLAAAARATSTGASSSADGASEAAYSAAALAAAGLAAVAAKVWTGTGAHTPVVPRHMQPGSNRTGGPQKKGAPAASPIKMGDYEDVSSLREKRLRGLTAVCLTRRLEIR